MGVIPEPEVLQFQIEPESKFMILASDGVWEFITSDEAIEMLTLTGHSDSITGLCLSPDGNYLLSNGMDSALCRWVDFNNNYSILLNMHIYVSNALYTLQWYVVAPLVYTF